MKRQSTNMFTRLSKEELEVLTTQVNEVLVPEFKNGHPKIFSVADLWNIQRQKRNFVQRRSRF